MIPSLVNTALVGLTVSAVAIALFRYHSERQRAAYPPGPPGQFLIGNLRDMPRSHSWIRFTEWGRTYGPLTYINVAGRPWLIVNTQEAAIALLEKRASIYSDRPRFVMFAELCGQGSSVIFQPLGPVLRKQRKYLTQALHPRVVEKDFVPLQEKMIRKLVQGLLDTPDNYSHLIHRVMGEIIQTVTYGAFYDGDLDLVDLGVKAMEIFVKTRTFGYLVDFFPTLKYVPSWFPGAKFKRDAKAWRAICDLGKTAPFEMVKRKKAAGEMRQPCFTSIVLDQNEVDGGGALEEEVIAATARTLFGGGSDTIAGTLLTFMLAMTIYPEVQARARKELDGVIRDRLPLSVDKEATPYLNAVLLETLRWHPIGPIGSPHKLRQDDSYNGYLIPAGTGIIVNVWGIMHDEQHFPDPFTFNPGRWLSTVSDGSPPPIDPWTVNFGYGRRICPGVHVAQSGLWIAMATILSSLEIGTKMDPKTGSPIVPRAEWMGENVSAPRPFLCDIKPRSQAWADRIRTAVMEKEKSDLST